MTAREWPRPEPGAAPPAGCTQGGASLALPAPTTPVGTSLWEGWYAAASAEQRRQLLDQADRQGLISGHQLPALPTAARAAPLLDLLAGRVPTMPVDAAPEPDWLDRDLDDRQRLAVCRALGTPDVALIAGYPGCGKSRVLAEILRQTLRRGQRILFLAPRAAALDVVLERLAAAGDTGWLRLGASPATSAAVAARTLEAQSRTFREQTRPAAVAAVEPLRRAIAEHRDHLDRCTRLEALAAELERCRDAMQRLDALSDPAAVLPAVAAVAEIEETLARLTAEREQVLAEQTRLSDEEQHLRPLVEAKQCHRWWTGAWWKATVQGAPLARLEELAPQLRQLDDRLADLDRRCQALAEEARQQVARHDAERRQAVAAEVQRRAGERADLEQKRAVAAERQQALLAEVNLPADGLTALCEQTQTLLRRDEQELAARTGWLEALQQADSTLPEQLVQTARLLAAPLDEAGLTGADLSVFDLLVLDDAHLLTEEQLTALARSSRRWLLVGEPTAELPLQSRRGDAVPLACGPFHRLWGCLHVDPRQRSARWSRANGRLVACLRRLGEDERRWLSREPVFDRPEIEVGILACPDCDPCVVEVLFPETTSIAEAKQFIYHELHELPIQVNSPMPAWHEADTCIRLELSTLHPASGAAAACELAGNPIVVSLDEGVREHVGRCTCAAADERPWPTVALEFARARGWDRCGAERWVEERLGWRDPDRTAVLDHCHRASPALADALSQLLYAGASLPTGEARFPDLGPALEFVAVPAGPRADARHGGDPTPRWGGGGTATLPARARTQRGAGLEIDLARPFPPEALPADLAAALPDRGIVNPAEAQALVAELEALAADPAVVGACLAWQQTRSSRSPAVAILSLFPAQVELLRLLIERSPTLSAGPLTFEVGTPGALAQRECLIALLGLTRSHASRAVPFSNNPHDLLTALTRAAGRLLIFGDPGTLTRRSGWFGGLDHLDEATGPLEQALAARLVAHLCDPETPSRTLRSRESSSA